MSAQAGIPAGFELDPRFQPHTFGGLVGPFYTRRQGNDLSLQYLASTQLGDWVQSEVTVLTPGSRTASATGQLLANGNPVVRMSANFRIARMRTPEAGNSSEI